MNGRAAFALLLAGASSDCAAAAPQVRGSLVATTDYVFQGLTQSSHDPALQGDLHLETVGGWFGGVWASTANPPPDRRAGAEINLYLGHTWIVSPQWTAAASYTRYAYPNGASQSRYDHDEVLARVGYTDRASFAMACAPHIRRYSLLQDAVRQGRECSFEVTGRQPLGRRFALTAGMGYYDLSDLFPGSYWAWDGGVTLALPRLQLSLSRFAVQREAREAFGTLTADGHWAFTAAWRF
jgi:uncharacterized protein (TIGR02001 family)